MKLLTTIILLTVVFIPFNRVKAQLKAGFTTANTSGCAPFLVQFSDASTGGTPTTWNWNFGNGQTSTDKNPLIKFQNAGVYTVTLTVGDGSATSTVQKQGYVTVFSEPVINNILLQRNTCVSDVEKFSASITDSQNIIQWKWNYGDGDSSFQKAPQHVYSASGIFRPVLQVTNIYGCKVRLSSIVNVDNNVNIDFSYNYQDACIFPSTITFTGKRTSLDSVYLQWNFGNGKTSAELNPIQTYTVPGNYNIKLIGVTYPNGCADTLIKNIKIGTPVANFSLPQSTCLNVPLLFSDSSSPQPISDTWDFGDGHKQTGKNVYNTFTNADTYTITLTAKFGSCTKQVTKNILITARPNVSFTASGNLSSCQLPQTISFTNTSNGASSYTWDFGDGSAKSNNTNVSHVYTEGGSNSVMLIGTNSSGCSDTSVQSNLVKLQPFKIISIGNTPFTGCAPQIIQFTPSFNSNNVVSYKWNLGDGTTSTAPNPTYKYNNAGNYSVRLIATNNAGCTDIFSLSNAVTLGILPTIDFDANPKSVCASDSIQFIDKSPSPLTNWTWNFGDGSISNIQNPKYKYTDSGNFDIRLIGSINGCRNTLIKRHFLVIKPPIANFTFGVNCNDYSTVNFSNKSIGADSLIWSFGDKDSSSIVMPSHQYKKTGSYIVALSTYNKNGCRSTIKQNVPVLDTNGALSLSPQKIFYCKYDTVQFNLINYAANNIKSLTWNFGDSVIIGPLNTKITTQTYTYIKPGTFNPQLIVNNFYNCNDTFNTSQPIDVFGPTASFSTTSSACIDSTIIFNDFSFANRNNAITNWYWDYGDGTTENLTSPPFKHTYTSKGNYTALLKITDAKGCFDSVYSIAPVVISSLRINAGNDTTICLGAEATLQPSGASTYTWDNNNTLSCTDCTNPIAKPLTNQTYYVSATNDLGCSIKDSVSIKLQQPVSIKVSGADSLCAGDKLTLNATGASTYLWVPSDQSSNLTGSSITIAPTSPVTYTVIGRDAYNCFGDTNQISIPVFPKPQIKFPDSVVILPSGVAYNLQPFISNDIISLQWTPLNSLSCTNCANPVATPLKTTTYTVTGTNSGACSAQASVVLEITCKNNDIFIPNTFSPNNDGMNDLFYPRGKGFYSVRTFRIFNRLGQIVFENHNFNSNDPSAGWDGKFKGQQLPPDVYIYQIVAICENDARVIIKGNVTLLR